MSASRAIYQGLFDTHGDDVTCMTGRFETNIPLVRGGSFPLRHGMLAIRAMAAVNARLAQLDGGFWRVPVHYGTCLRSLPPSNGCFCRSHLRAEGGAIRSGWMPVGFPHNAVTAIASTPLRVPGSHSCRFTHKPDGPLGMQSLGED
jgi:hypothetical protein